MVASRVTSPDGTALAVYESGLPSGPTVVAVHGYPDDHTVWDGLAGELAGTMRVITYDVRGAGASDVPAATASYRIPHLVDDLVTVLDAAAPDSAVHLVAHDWGSIQTWSAVTDPRLKGRVLGYTSISGPSLEQAGDWLRCGRAHKRAAARQLAHSYYTLLFQLPKAPEAAIRLGLLDRAARHTTHADQVHGLELYRANMRGLARARPQRVDVPVQVIAPRDDSYVTADLAFGAPEPWVPDLRTHEVAGGHWVVRERPDVIAGYVREFAERLQA